MKFKNLFIAIGIMLLAACSDEQVESQASILTDSLTITVTPTVSTFTKTLVPTKTPSPTFQPTNTISVATANAIATTDALRNSLVTQIPELEEYRAFCHSTYCYGVEVSPDGQWIYFSNGSEIEIFNMSGRRVGKYSFYEISGRSDVAEGYISGIHWSKDKRYLYLATQFGDGGPEAYFGYQYSLARVNLENGTWKDIGVSGVTSFSSNEEYIVYSTNTSEIRLRNLRSGQESIYFTPEYYLYFGGFVWSPDNKKVVFVATPEDWYTSDSRFAILMIDVANQTTSQLYESSLPFYFPAGWVETDQVLLQRYEEWGNWTLDLSTNTITSNP